MQDKNYVETIREGVLVKDSLSSIKTGDTFRIFYSTGELITQDGTGLSYLCALTDAGPVVNENGEATIGLEAEWLPDPE
jgi:hypothetical protein